MNIFWRRLDMPGAEVAELNESKDGWTLSGVAVMAHRDRPCVLEYDISCDTEWQTKTVGVSGHLGGKRVTLNLSRNDAGDWAIEEIPGQPLLQRPDLAGCIDIDLGFSPSTNLLPIRRLTLGIGKGADVRAAWVRFPELTLEVLEQRYTRLAEDKYAYESGGGTFRRELTVDGSGFILEYPDFWRAEAMTNRKT